MLSYSASKSLARRLISRQAPTVGATTTNATFTTYSGGQPFDGQGGFYGAIKSRSEKNAAFKPGSRAEPTDLATLQRLMDAVHSSADQEAAWTATVAKEENTQLLQRLVVKGAPAWGLSVDQREFVARFLAKK